MHPSTAPVGRQTPPHPAGKGPATAAPSDSSPRRRAPQDRRRICAARVKPPSAGTCAATLAAIPVIDA